MRLTRRPAIRGSSPPSARQPRLHVQVDIIQRQLQFTCALLLTVRTYKTKYIQYMHTWYTHIMWNIKFHTLFRISMCTHTSCAMRACMYAYKYTRTKMFHSRLQHHCMHSKINQAKINCLITCQYRQKPWHIDHASLGCLQTRSALETCQHMQIHAQLLIHAYTCRNISHPLCMKIRSL
jgi:hypothetical protein